MEIGSKGSYPFKTQPGKEVARGWSESRVFHHEPGWIIKVTYRGWRNTLKQLEENKSDYEFFKSRLGETVPETQFVRAQNEKGKEVNIVRQREIKGRTLAKYPLENLLANKEATHNLVGFFNQVLEMWKNDGRIPDLVVFGGKPWNSANLIIEDNTNKVYLVDTSASKRFQSKNAPFLYRKLSESVVKNIGKFVEKYGNA